MSESRSFIGRFFHGLWSLVIGIYRTLIVLSVLLAAAVIWFSVHGVPIKVDNHVALVVRPTGRLIDAGNRDSQELIDQLNNELPSFTVTRDLVDAIDDAAKDPRISAAVLKLDDMSSAGLPQIEEISAAVGRFRAAGKPVYAYGESYSQAQYLLAVSADQVSLNPMGNVGITGLGLYTNYFKDGLDKLGVEINVFRVGEYKSAVEPFLRNDMSPDARTANRAWLDDLWKSYNERVASARKLNGAPATDYVNGLAAGLQKFRGDSAALAKADGLVDNVESLTEFRKRVGAKVGMDKDKGSFRQIESSRYLEAVQREAGAKPSAKIALVTVEGDIVDGRGSPDQAGGDTISAMLDHARLDDDVDAVVLRVDSPGGSVTAAEKIRRAVRALQDDGTPVVVSMSNLAASGGYWISMDADEIWAHDSTITGSIGIFGLFPTINKPLEKLGIHTDGVGTTSLAGAMRIDRPLDPDLRTMIQTQIEFGYRQFIDGVAQGRDIPPEQVEKIARGRVWSGAAAKQLGLVDKIGGLKDAVASAAKLADLKPGQYQLDELKPPQNLFHEVFSQLTGRTDSRALIEAQLRQLHAPGVDQLLMVSQTLGRFNDPRGEYAYCFCDAVGGGLQ